MCLEDLINYFAQPEEDMGKYRYYYYYIILYCVLKLNLL